MRIYTPKFAVVVAAALSFSHGSSAAPPAKANGGATPALTAPPPALTNAPKPALPAPALRLRGWVDLHAHPMIHVAFGGKLVHGAPDVGSLVPADSRCQARVRATSMEHALGHDNSTHGGWGAFDNPCGDDIRKAVIDQLQQAKGAVVTPDKARGAPDFAHYPKWNDVTHQKMWIDWIRRAYDGGLRVMVALATHNQTLAAAVSGPGDGPTDDKASGDLQIDEIKAMVGRHRDFMEVALTSADVRRIVLGNKLAIVLGVELDNIGNFNRAGALSAATIGAELRRLHDKGVRYAFPIHVIDNRFGGTAIYENAFNVSNYREFGSFWSLRCSAPADGIGFRVQNDGFDAAVAFVKATKLGIDVARNPPPPPACPAGTGHVNTRGLTLEGEIAVKEMMKLGMMIDIDHMSQLSADRTIDVALAVPGGGYPLASGHNGPRGRGGDENARTPRQLQMIAKLRGMVGVGCEGADAHRFARTYADVARATGGRAGIGTDLNGLVKAPPPRPGSRVVYDASFPKSRTGAKEWDYNVDGVAHYGMLSDYVRDIRSAPNGNALVDDTFMSSAEVFADMWRRAEVQKDAVR
ncbi:MAG: membrane dipeptidase [Labilithrix sp.]|nr:membrane dipeptidase [Labilithrix sp.]